MRSPARMRAAPSHARTQTQRISGRTSQKPPARTPPQGPFRSSFGQFIGQDMPFLDNRHTPHMRQSNISPFTLRSNGITMRSTRAKPSLRNSGAQYAMKELKRL